MEERLLCVLDGAKGFPREARAVFGSTAVIERCRCHKREMGIPKRQTAA